MLVLGYLVLTVLGSGCILVSMLLGHLLDVGAQDPGAHAGADVHTDGDDRSHPGHFPLFSPLALATLSASLGGLGLVGRFGLRMEDARSLLFALPGALVVTYVVTWVTWKSLRP